MDLVPQMCGVTDAIRSQSHSRARTLLAAATPTARASTARGSTLPVRVMSIILLRTEADISPLAATFSNEYFRLLFDEKWQERKWNGPPQYVTLSCSQLIAPLTWVSRSTGLRTRPTRVS